MSLIAIKTMDLSINGTPGTLTNSVLATDAVTDVKVSASAAIQWSKISKTGSSLADLATRSASDLSSGTLADARLSGNVALLNASNAFTNTNSWSGTSTFTGNIGQTGTTTFSTGTGAVSINGAATFASTVLLNADPTLNLQAATKQYVDSLVQGLDVKASVRAATTTTLPANTYSGGILTATSNGALAAQDGVTLVLNDRLLVKNEATGANNGLYYVSQVGDGSNPYTLTRTPDASSSGEVAAGLFTFVKEGTLDGTTGWVLSTANPITLGTTSLSFTQFSSAGVILAGSGLTKTGSTLSVNVDGTTIDISSNNLEVKAGGITDTQVNSSAAIAWTKISKTGSSLADLATRSASDLSSGTLADARLSGNVPLLNAANAFTSTNSFSGIVTTAGRVKGFRKATSTPVTLATSDYTVETNLTSAGAVAVGLPSSPTTGTVFIVKDGKGDAATHNITIAPASGNIDGVSTYVITQNYGYVTLQYEGSQWLVVDSSNSSKSVWSAIIASAAGTETTLSKPSGAPDIPDSEDTEVFIDGRKVFRGSSLQYTVSGSAIAFATLAAGQSLELRYRA